MIFCKKTTSKQLKWYYQRKTQSTDHFSAWWEPRLQSFSAVSLSAKKKENGRTLQNFRLFHLTVESRSCIPCNAILPFSSSPSSSWCCLWNRQVRNRNRCDECHETWTDYEIYHSRRHGWYYCYLRSCRCCAHRRCPRRTIKIHTVQVSRTFWGFFTISFWVMWPKKKKSMITTNPLHSHLLIQHNNHQVTLLESCYSWAECLVTKVVGGGKFHENWRESDDLINLPIGKYVFADHAQWFLLLRVHCKRIFTCRFEAWDTCYHMIHKMWLKSEKKKLSKRNFSRQWIIFKDSSHDF